MSITFSGLASGIDSSSMIDQLVSAERAAAKPLTQKQTDLTAHKSIINSLTSVLSSLGTSAKALATPADVALRTATSSDSNISVSASSSALATSHSVRVQQLARAQVATSRTFASAGAGVLGAGSVGLTVGSTTKSVSWTASDSLADIAQKINSADAGAKASVLYDGSAYRIVVTAEKSGTAAAVSFADGGDSLGLANPANITSSARDAILDIDGVTVTRGSNVIDDAIAGLTITAKAAHAATVDASSVAVALDRDGLRDKVKAFVAAYNSVNGALQVQLGYTGTVKGSSTLFGDSTLRQLQTALGGVMTRGYAGATLAGIGLARDKTGTMTLDESKLSAALAKDPDAVGKLFTTGGLASATTTLTDNYSRGSDGVLALKTKGIESRYKLLQTQIDHIDRRADNLQATLQKQFNALETAMSSMQSQSAYLSRVLG
jgi:flagellar hook-associated protein 2